VLGRQLPVADGNEGSQAKPAQAKKESACYLRKRDGTRFLAEIWTAPIQHSGDSLRGTLTIVAAHTGR
jgi:hypothetical protein